MKKLLLLLTATVIATGTWAQANEPGSGNALQFNGGSDHVNFGDVLNNLDFPVSISAWVYVEQQQQNPIVSTDNNSGFYNGIIFRILGNNRVEWRHSDGSGWIHRNITTTTSNTVPIQQWTHLAVVANTPDDITIYFNGIEVAASYGGTPSHPMSHDADPFHIGHQITTQGTHHYFAGKVDEVCMWNVARTQTEIREDMCKKLLGNEPGLVGYWRMDENGNGLCGGATDVCDATGNGINGTLQ